METDITYEHLSQLVRDTPLFVHPETTTPFDKTPYLPPPTAIDTSPNPSHRPFIKLKLEETKFPDIIGLDTTMSSHYPLEIAGSIQSLLTPLNEPVIIEIGIAAHLFMLIKKGLDWSIVCGICGSGKLLEGHIVPLGEKTKPFDEIIGHDLTFQHDYSFNPLNSLAIGTVLRGLQEELPDLDTPELLIIQDMLKRGAVVLFPFFDGRYNFLNFPVIVKGTEEVLQLLLGIGGAEWEGGLFLVPLQSLCDETYNGYPISHGVRYVARRLLEKYIEP